MTEIKPQEMVNAIASGETAIQVHQELNIAKQQQTMPVQMEIDNDNVHTEPNAPPSQVEIKNVIERIDTLKPIEKGLARKQKRAIKRKTNEL